MRKCVLMFGSCAAWVLGMLGLARFFGSRFRNPDDWIILVKIYSMLIVFAGKGEALANAEGFVASVAEGVVVAAPDGLELPADGGLMAPCRTARFETYVMARSGRTYEAGRVTFPEIDSYLDVYTPEAGLVVANEGGLESGSISWHIRMGGGLFEGATGIVTGNFTGRPDGTFVDHQFYKLLLPDVKPAR